MLHARELAAAAKRIGVARTRTGDESQAPLAKTNRVTRTQGTAHNWPMEQSIRKLRPDVAMSMNFMLAIALVAAVSVNALLLLTHL
jgi:hypothetical protein